MATLTFEKFQKNNSFGVWSLIYTLLLLVCFPMVAANPHAYQKNHKPVQICESKECLRSAANLALSMDLTADPCEDFYQFSCGNWEKQHPRPNTLSEYDWFLFLQDKVDTLALDFLTKNSMHQPRAVQQAKDMFTACMDTETLEKRGLEPTFAVLKSLGLPPFPSYLNMTEGLNYSTYSFNWFDTVIKLKTRLDMNVIIGFELESNRTNSSYNDLILETPLFVQPFHRLKFRFEVKQNKSSSSQAATDINHAVYALLMEIFARKSELYKDSELREAKLLQNIHAAINTFISIDKDINTLIYEENMDENYDEIIYSVDELQLYTDRNVTQNNTTNSLIWRKYLESIFEISNVTLNFNEDKIKISSRNLKYMANIAAYVAKTPPVILELYLWIKVVDAMVEDATSEPYRLLQNTHRVELPIFHPESRKLQCVHIVNDMLAVAVSYGITDEHFLNFTKTQVEKLLNELKSSFEYLVKQAKWIDDNTKIAFYQKINETKSRIGSPTWLFDKSKMDEYYEGIVIKTDTHLQNMINVIQAEIRRSLNTFRTTTFSKDPWKPTEVNVRYNRIRNTITAPTVTLRYPFFNLGLDSLNYGSLGSILGHEVAHGFDSYGRRYDKNGNELPWWTKETVSLFEDKTKCFIDQYNNFYLPEIDKHVNGGKTLAENIADTSGVKAGLVALRGRLRNSGPEPKLPGFGQYTSEQMYFLSFGNTWCGIDTEESLKQNIATDAHSPRQFRVIGVLQNIGDFAKAWKCSKGTKMNPETQCIIY